MALAVGEKGRKKKGKLLDLASLSAMRGKAVARGVHTKREGRKKRKRTADFARIPIPFWPSLSS